MSDVATNRCVICGKTAAYLWTLDNMESVSVTYLCTIDSAPLIAILDAAGDIPPHKQVPLPERGQPVPDLKSPFKKGRQRLPKLEPLLDWTPPGQPKLRQEVIEAELARQGKLELSDVEKMVKTLREEGKSWRQIGEMMGISKQAAFQRYQHLNPGPKPEKALKSHDNLV